MSNKTPKRAVMRALNCKFLDLVKGDGYWYFVYDDEENKVFETHSVMTMRLNDMPVEEWVNEGRAFILETEKYLELL
jgi:hypothetical protein